MNLRHIREARGMSQIELAIKMSLRQSAISQWETGKSKPALSNLIKLAEILDCSLSELVDTHKSA